MINFRWGFADAGKADGQPARNLWNHGSVKRKTCVIDLYLAFVKFVREQTNVDDVRVRLFFPL
jgi:hypothetical protein